MKNAVGTAVRSTAPTSGPISGLSSTLETALTQLNTAESFLDQIESRIGVPQPGGPETSAENVPLTLTFASTVLVGRLSNILERLDRVVSSL